MGAEGTSPPARRGRLKSLVVLLIGVAYLAGVYFAVPEQRGRLRSRYWRPPERRWPGERASDPGIEGFEERLVEDTRQFGRLRATAEASVMWTLSFGGEQESIHATLFVDGPDRIRLDTTSGERQRTIILGGDTVWMFWSGEDGAGMSTWDRDKEWWFGYPLPLEGLVVFYPFVCPEAFDEAWGGRFGTEGLSFHDGGYDELDGRRCKVVQADLLSTGEARTCRLWIAEETGLLVKAVCRVFDVPFHWESDEDVVLQGAVDCVLTALERDPPLTDALFDPVAVSREFAERGLGIIEESCRTRQDGGDAAREEER